MIVFNATAWRSSDLNRSSVSCVENLACQCGEPPPQAQYLGREIAATREARPALKLRRCIPRPFSGRPISPDPPMRGSHIDRFVGA